MTNEEFVRSLYWGLMGREPDPPGLAHHLAVLDEGRHPHLAADVIRGFLQSHEFRLVHASQNLTNLLQVQVEGDPFAHVASLGSNCYVSSTLKTMQLKRYSLPFDWIFSSLGMVAHCIEDDFARFLDPREYRPNPPEQRPGPKEGLCDHLFYRREWGVERVFNHFDPSELEYHAYLVRAVGRFRRLLDSPARKLFLAVVPTFREHEVREPFARLVEVVEARTENAQIEVVALLPAGGADDFRYALLDRRGVHTLSVLQPLTTMQALLFGEMMDELFVRRLIARHRFELVSAV
jgi:hypothetical protein